MKTIEKALALWNQKNHILKIEIAKVLLKETERAFKHIEKEVQVANLSSEYLMKSYLRKMQVAHNIDMFIGDFKLTKKSTANDVCHLIDNESLKDEHINDLYDLLHFIS